MAGTPDHASTKTNIDLDVIVQLNSSSPAASSKRLSTDSFSNPNFAKLRVLLLQLCQALGQLRNSPLCMPPRTVRCQGPAPASCHGGHFLLQWLRGETTTTPTDVDWHWRALVEASSCPLRQNVTQASGGPTRFVTKTIRQSNVFELDNLPRQVQPFQLDTSTKTTKQNTNNWRREEEPNVTACLDKRK